MKICSVDLKGNDAIICLMSLQDNLFELPDCRIRKLSISDATNTEQLKKFQFDFAKLMEDYQIDNVVIRERFTKGKFAGGSVGFKLEATIQLIDNLNVELISSSRIKEIGKRIHSPDNFNDTGLKQFQEQAFITAFAYLNQ